jgi:hypothetical protein
MKEGLRDVEGRRRDGAGMVEGWWREWRRMKEG